MKMRILRKWASAKSSLHPVPWFVALFLSLSACLVPAQETAENKEEVTASQPAALGMKPAKLPRFPENQDLIVGTRQGRIFKMLPDGSSTLIADRTGHMQLILGPDGISLDLVSKGISRITPTSDGSLSTPNNGHVVRLLEGPERLHGLVRDFDGHLWTCQFMDAEGTNGVYKEVDGKLVKQDAPNIGSYYSMTIDNEGRVHLISFKSIHRREPDGSWTDLVKKYDLRGMGSNIRNAIFDRDGNLFIMASGVWKLTPDGEFSLYSDFRNDTFTKDTEYRTVHPIGLAFDANGVLYSTGEYRAVFDKETGKTIKRLIEGHIYRHNPETGARELFAVVGLQPYYIVFRTLPDHSDGKAGQEKE